MDTQKFESEPHHDSKPQLKIKFFFNELFFQILGLIILFLVLAFLIEGEDIDFFSIMTIISLSSIVLIMSTLVGFLISLLYKKWTLIGTTKKLLHGILVISSFIIVMGAKSGAFKKKLEERMNEDSQTAEESVPTTSKD